MKIHKLGGSNKTGNKTGNKHKPNTISLYGQNTPLNQSDGHLSFSTLRKQKQTPMSKGSEIHKVLENIILDRKIDSQYYDQCLEFMRSDQSPVHNIDAEFEIYPEYKNNVKIFDVDFVFIIDLLIFSGDVCRIIDYKTCQALPFFPDEINLQQILTYAYCMFIMYNILDIQVEIVYILMDELNWNVKTFKIKLDEKDLIEQGEILKKTIKE